jgi:hypothetical protein
MAIWPHARASRTAAAFDQAATTNPRQLHHQLARAASEAGLAPRSPQQQAHQQIRRRAHEGVHVQLLIRSVELRSGGQHPRILEIPESGFGVHNRTVGDKRDLVHRQECAGAGATARSTELAQAFNFKSARPVSGVNYFFALATIISQGRRQLLPRARRAAPPAARRLFCVL